MKFTNKQIEQMRYELANPEVMKKRIEEENAIDEFIETTKKKIYCRRA